MLRNNLVMEMEQMKEKNEDLLMEARHSEECFMKKRAELNERSSQLKAKLDNQLKTMPASLRSLFS